MKPEEDQVRKMINAIGATAECTRGMFVQLKKQGFTDTQALELTRTWMCIVFQPRQQSPQKEDSE